MTVRELVVALSAFDSEREVCVEDASESSPLLNVTAVYDDRVLNYVVISHAGSVGDHEERYSDLLNEEGAAAAAAVKVSPGMHAK